METRTPRKCREIPVQTAVQLFPTESEKSQVQAPHNPHLNCQRPLKAQPRCVLEDFIRARVHQGKRYQQYVAHSKYVTMVKAQPLYMLLFKTTLKALHFIIPCPWNTSHSGRKFLNRGQLLRWTFFLLNTFQIMLDSLRNMKYFALWFLGCREPLQAFSLAYCVSESVIQIYAVYMLSCLQYNFSEIETLWNTFEEMLKAKLPKKPTATGQTKQNILLVVYGVSTLLYAIFENILKYWLQGSSVEASIVQNGDELYKDIFMWNSDIAGANCTQEILTVIGNGSLHWSVKYLSLPNYWLSTFSRVFGKFVELVVISIAMATTSHVLSLKEVVSQRLQRLNEGTDNLIDDISCWEMYRNVKTINQATNDKYKSLLVLFHSYTFLSFSVLIKKCLDTNYKFVHILFTVLDLVQRLYTYFLARKAGTINEKLRKWIRGLPTYTNKFKVGRVHFSRSIMSLELQDEPLGIGRGEFFVNDKFLYKFVGGAASMVFLIITFH